MGEDISIQYERPLTPMMQRFADEYLSGELSGVKFSPVRAYEHAGYTINGANPYGGPNKLLRHPKVAAYIKERMDAYSMSSAEVLARWTELARQTAAGDVLRLGPQGNIMIDGAAVVENAHFIKSFGFDANGNPKVEFHDPTTAMRDIAKARGMLKDGLEVSGPGGGAVPVALQVQFVMPDGQVAHPAGNALPPAAEDFTEFDED